MNVVEIEGVRYIKASDAAKRVGYTTDYVGQLARADKIDAQQIGRAWYVKETDILEHKKGNVRSNKQKTQEFLKKSVGEAIAEHAIYNTPYAPPAYVPEYRKRLLDTSVTYERDELPLTLSLNRGEGNRDAHSIEVTSDTEESNVHVTRLGRDLEIEEASAPSRLVAERTQVPMHGDIMIQPEELNESVEAARVSPQPAHQPIDTSLKLTGFERRLLMHDADVTVAEGITDRRQNELAPQLTFIPAQVPGRRRPLALGPRLMIALTPVALLVALAVAASSVFLHKVIVFDTEGGSEGRSSLLKTYEITQVATVKQSLSR